MERVFVYNCPDENATAALARQMATIARPGDVWALYGTLGMGKSVWARAFIQKLCGAGEVPSPTFTLVQVYETPAFDIYHYDLYRLKSPEEIWELNIEEALHAGVCLIEWPEKMGAYLPGNCFKLQIEACGKTGRKFTITPGSEHNAQRLAQCGGTDAGEKSDETS